MIELTVGPEDLANLRFGFSPLVELALSVRVLGDPRRHVLHLPWVREVEGKLDPRDYELLRALVPATAGYIPDFLAPPPRSPLVDFESAVRELLSTDPQVVREEAEKVARIRPAAAPALAALRSRTGEGIEELARTVRGYWAVALADHWSEMVGVLEGEILYRARRLAVEGFEGVFDSLHALVAFADTTLRIDKPHRESLELGGRGIQLVPSVFAWPDVFVVTDRPWQPTIWYPARGVAWLWQAAPPSGPRSLERLVGGPRARVLRSLAFPATTSEVARRLGLAASTVSEQLARLSETGLLGRTRIGRRVFYELTPEGVELLERLGSGGGRLSDDLSPASRP